MTPSSSTRRPLAARVEPVEVMSTTISATPEAGAASVAPRLSTIRYSAMPAWAKCWRVMVMYLVAMRSQRPWRERKSEATSARSCMWVTSIQASGTAMTTSA
ncbi:hypothetical protein D3C87_1794350 [compost metagenome]